MASLIDRTGERFGRLTVLSYAGPVSTGASWKCVCDCGNEKVASALSLTSGNVASCGCLRAEVTAQRNKDTAKHGHTRNGLTPTYRSWHAMKQRCRDPKARNYPRYGGRGISVCDRWLEAYLNFLADMGERPEGMTLDRIDNNGNYEPGNCRWATPLEQIHNRG